MSVLAGLTLVCFLSPFFLDYRTGSKIQTVKVVVKHVPDYSASREKHDLGFLTFDLQVSFLRTKVLVKCHRLICGFVTIKMSSLYFQADLSPLFNWNVKQLFLYLTAEYETKTNKVNQVVLWDKIIQRGENAVLDYRSMNTKYYFWDDGNGLL